MKKILFLDLEETLIDSIDSCKVLWQNLDKIMCFIDAFEPDEIVTFSFALHSDVDKKHWQEVKRFLKKHYSLNIKTQKFEIDDLKIAFLRDIFGMVVKNELIDFIRLCSKERVFEWMIDKEQGWGRFVLIDDTVTSRKQVITMAGRKMIEFINVTKMPPIVNYVD